jgi:tRNA (guanosine-2'-O-)-methyltransferase
MNNLIQYLENFITSERLLLFNQILHYRTRYLTVVLEDIYQQHNASAVVRTCDCFGIQDVHTIVSRNNFIINKQIALGAEKWLSIKKYLSAKECINKLKNDGYRIIATSIEPTSQSLANFDLHKSKAAIFFGTELTGVSNEIKHSADELLNIPMLGFTESLNISVSVGIILSQLRDRLEKSEINWTLSKIEEEEIKLQWLMNSIKKSELIVKQFKAKKS